jgi:tetratricopeptide (TPR) repeat protein
MPETIANRYRILSELGRGNMGVVYRVADTLEGDRPLALKVIEVPGAITPELRLLFKEEFRAMTKLRHPNTIEVFGYGQIDATRQYLTMELVPGRELSEVIGNRPMPLAEAYPLLIQLLQALGFIHSRLYVHHDIKAPNIRVTPDGTLKLMDFGLMCQLGRPALGGRVTGTPGYLPPEIVRGGVINASTDLYSVGCLAFEMLTGRLPFAGTVGEVIRAHAQTPPPRLRTLRPEAPEALDRLVARLLEKDQTRRYQEASDVIADLAALAGLTITRQNLDQRRSYLTTGTLVGREGELAQLEAALTEATAGRGGAVFVGAPAGVGKSRLVQELVLHAKLDHVVVAHAHCLEAGMGPYEPLRQALRVLAPLATPEEQTRFAPLLNKLVPELFPAPACGLLPCASPEEEKVLVLEAVAKFVAGLSARQPLLLLLDDLHWCDMQSLELFNHLIRQAGGQRVLCVGTFRSDETPPSSPVWHTVEEGLTRYLKLQPFDETQLVRLVEAMLHRVELTPTCAGFLFGATAGNAFFLTEFLRHLMESDVLVQRDGVWRLEGGPGSYTPPTSVAETVDRRLANVSEGSRHLARLASVVGRYLERDMLISLSGLDPETLFVRLDELIERQFLVREEGRYSFPHDRMREALYGGMPDAERRAVHQRCGEYLESRHADELGLHLQDLAHHFSHGDDPLKAYTYVSQAGDAAYEAGATGLALEHWLVAERLLEGLETPDKRDGQIDLWWDIAGVGFNILPAEAVKAGHKLIPALEADVAAGVPDAPIELIKAHALLAVAYGFCGQPRRGMESADRAIALLPPGDTPMHGALIMVKVANLFPAGRFDELLALCAQAATVLIGPDLTGQPPMVFNTRVGAASYPNTVVFQGVRPDPARRDYALWAANEGHAPSLVNIIQAFFGIWSAWTGRQAEAVTYIEEATQHCRKLGAPTYPWPLYLRAYLLWQRGEFEDALKLAEQALRMPHMDTVDLAKYLLVVLKGQVQLALGEREAAESAFSLAEAQGREAPMAVVLMRALLGRAELLVMRGDGPGARRVLEEALAIARAPETRNPLHEALAERGLGELALSERMYTQARGHLGRAMAIVALPEQDNLIEQAHVHRLLGAVLLGQGDAIAAAEPLRKAGELYHRLKNRHWLHAVNQHLESLHQQPATPAAAEVTPEARFEHLRGMLMR